MPYTLVLNSDNVISTNNTTYKYNFINGSFVVPENSEMCVSQIVMPYSFFNINKGLYNNNSFNYYWDGVLYKMIFKDGFYSVSDLNQYMEATFLSLNQYLVNTATGFNQYFISIQSNQTYYANQFIMYPIPTSLPSGFSAPSGFVYSSTGNTPQVVISSSNNFGSIIGFTSGTYPSLAQTATYNVLSNLTPNATPVNSIVVRCNMINNACTFPTDILDVFSINTSFGSSITYSPPYEKWVSVSEGSYASMTVTLEDQNFGVIEANDSNVLIALLLRVGKKREMKQTLVNKPLVPIIKQLKFRDENDKDDEGD